MPKLHVVGLLVAFTSAHHVASAWGQTCCYYQADPRVEPTNQALSTLIAADCLIVPRGRLEYQPLSDTYHLRVSPWTVLIPGGSPACSQRDYHGQPSAVEGGSGVLVGEDLVFTAGHNVSTEVVCDDRQLVFDYGNIDDPLQMICQGTDCWVSIPADDVYDCDNIVKSSITFDDDWALLRLTRAVTDRSPLPIRRTWPLPIPTDVIVIGHPNRIPMKVEYTSITDDTGLPCCYRMTVHALYGSSGSMVVEAATGEVVGIDKGGIAGSFHDCSAECYRECFSDPIYELSQQVEPVSKAAPWIP